MPEFAVARSLPILLVEAHQVICDLLTAPSLIDVEILVEVLHPSPPPLFASSYCTAIARVVQTVVVS